MPARALKKGHRSQTRVETNLPPPPPPPTSWEKPSWLKEIAQQTSDVLSGAWLKAKKINHFISDFAPRNENQTIGLGRVNDTEAAKIMENLRETNPEKFNQIRMRMLWFNLPVIGCGLGPVGRFVPNTLPLRMSAQPVYNIKGTERALQHSKNWQGVSARETISRIAGPKPKVEFTEFGKTWYTHPETEMRVVYDNAGKYFRVENLKAEGTTAEYTDHYGKPIPDNVFFIKEGKTTQTGVPPEVRKH